MEAEKIKEVGQVQKELQIMHNQIKELQEITMQLLDILHPILAPPEKIEDRKEETSNLVPLAYELYSLREDIALCTKTLIGISKKIEL